MKCAILNSFLNLLFSDQKEKYFQSNLSVEDNEHEI